MVKALHKFISKKPRAHVDDVSGSRVHGHVIKTQGSRQNLCIIINNLGLVNNGCGQLHVRELQVAKQSETKLVKGQLTLFGERASSDTDNLSKG